MIRNYFDVLGVAPDASAEEIKRSYRDLARRYHPDGQPEAPDAAERWKAVVEAYGVLSDPRKRQAYEIAHGKGAPPVEVLADLLRDIRPGSEREPWQEDPEDGQVRPVEIPLERLAVGGSTWIPAPDDMTHLVGDLLEVQVPPGAPEGSVVEARSLTGLPVRLSVATGRHPVFSRQGADLLARVRVGTTTALFGGQAEVETLDGGRQWITIPPLAGRGHVVRIPGEGLPRPDGTGRGALLVEVQVGGLAPTMPGMLVPVVLLGLLGLLSVVAGVLVPRGGEAGLLGAANARLFAAFSFTQVMSGALLVAFVAVAGLLVSWTLSFFHQPLAGAMEAGAAVLGRQIGRAHV